MLNTSLLLKHNTNQLLKLFELLNGSAIYETQQL